MNPKQVEKISKVLTSKTFDPSKLRGDTQNNLLYLSSMIDEIQKTKYKETQMADVDDDDPIMNDEDEMTTDFFNAGAKNQDINKEVYRQNFCIETEIPNMYILGARVFPLDLNYVFRVCKYVLPDEKFNVRAYNWSKEKGGEKPSPIMSIIKKY